MADALRKFLTTYVGPAPGGVVAEPAQEELQASEAAEVCEEPNFTPAEPEPQECSEEETGASAPSAGGKASFEFCAFIPGSLGKSFSSFPYPKDLANQSAFEGMVSAISGTWLEEPGSFAAGGSGPWLFETDNRGFGGGSHRVGFKGSVSAADIGSLKSKGTLFTHGTSGSAHVRWEHTGIFTSSGETGSIKGPIRASAAAKSSEKRVDLSADESEVTVTGAASYPFSLAAPDIDYELVLRFKRDAAGKTVVSGTITTNVFPFYELMINGKSVWTYSSSGTGPGVWNLNTSQTSTLPATAF